MSNTSDKILDIAEDLLAKRGYNAFSYKDIANEIGIKTSSIHYHFPAKTDLVKSIMLRYRMAVEELLETLDSKNISNEDKLNALLEVIIHDTYKRKKRMCIGGILAIDVLQVDDVVISEVKKFFLLIEKWVEKTLNESGVENSKRKAQAIMASIEGTLLLARLYNDSSRLDNLKSRVKSLFD